MHGKHAERLWFSLRQNVFRLDRNTQRSRSLRGRSLLRMLHVLIIIIKNMKPTIPHLARVLCCTEAQVRAQFAKNIATMRADLEQANRTGRPVRGYSAERISADIAEMESRLLQ